MMPCPPVLTTQTVEYRPYAPTPAAGLPPYVYYGSAMANRNEAIAQTEKWQFDCLKMIASLGRLSNNWDGYGSRPPTDSVRQWASDLIVRTQLGNLQTPQIAPESDGGLQIDWQSGLAREIEFHIDGTAIEYLKLQDGKAIESGTFSTSDYVATETLITWLRRG